MLGGESGEGELDERKPDALRNGHPRSITGPSPHDWAMPLSLQHGSMLLEKLSASGKTPRVRR